jgi:hypothetical protein
MRTSESIRFFPRTFFLYFSLFNVYFFSCPFGFSYTSFVSTALFLMHSMLFFWNRFELPALQAGLVSQATPRLGGVMYFLGGNTEPYNRFFHDMRSSHTLQASMHGANSSVRGDAQTAVAGNTNGSAGMRNSFSQNGINVPGFTSLNGNNTFIPRSVLGEGNSGSASPAVSSIHSRASPIAGPYYSRFSTNSRSGSQTSLERELRGGNILYFGGGGEDDDSALAAYGIPEEVCASFFKYCPRRTQISASF